MAFRHQSSSYYEAERQEEMYQSSMGSHMGSGHMGHMGSGHMGHHMGSSQMGYGLGSGFSADSEYSNYSSITPSQSYGYGGTYGHQYGGGGMMGSSGYMGEQSSYYATNNGCNPCNKFF